MRLAEAACGKCDTGHRSEGEAAGIGARARRVGVGGDCRGDDDRHRYISKPAEMAREGRFVSVVFAAWIVGAILSLFGALSFAELGAAIPEAGGEYAYLRRGFGPGWGFLFGWTHSIVGRPSSLSSIAAGLVRFLGFLLPVIAHADFHAAHRDSRAHELAQAVRFRFYLGAADRGPMASGDDWRELSWACGWAERCRYF